jgi:hypothetical protein
MRTRSILAATFGAAALLAAVPASAAIADPGPSRPSFSKPEVKPQGWTLCATRTGKIRLATKWKPCTKWETSIPVAPVAQKKDDKPAPYWLKDDNTTKYCAPTNKVRGVWVIECKGFGQPPKPAPTATGTATAKPAS